MAFSEKLEAWFADCGRTLPWRGIDDPYRIWVSEIILQQTRIEQGHDYYLRFVEALPDVKALADADEEQVMRLWQGLGYYSRARNMQAAARYVRDELGCVFPNTYEGILGLKGVGRYTAAAIASFAYRLPYPVIDGNVYRFISRLHGIATPIGTAAAYDEFEALLLKQMDREHPDRFNAALMDFGALQCVAARPHCENCPFCGECHAHLHGMESALPVKAAKRPPQERHFIYVQLSWTEGGRVMVAMRRRTGGLWRGLYEPPLMESAAAPTTAEAAEAARKLARDEFGSEATVQRVSETVTHQLTHRTIKARFVAAELASAPLRVPPEYRVVSLDEAEKLPVSRLIDKGLHEM